MDKEAKSMAPSQRLQRTWFPAILLLFGLAVRVFSAWAYRRELCSDYTRAALMAKHMAEGVDFPVFFYGSNYMGSFEPAVSAALCFLFGASGFVVCLGTALIGFLVLPVVYLWARDMGGRPAGLVALAFCAVGPFEYFYYLGSPRGGYAAVIAASAFVLWMTGRMATREIHGERVAPASYLLLGVVAGLGWWSSQLMTPVLMASATALAFALRFRVFKVRVFLAGAAFLLGSLPWWVWNCRHDWETLDLVNAAASTPWRDGLHLLSARWVDLFGAAGSGGVLGGTVALAHLAALPAAVLLLVRRRAFPKDSLGRTHSAVILLLFAIFSVVFCRSVFAQFGAARYLLPLVPPVAVLLGSLVAAPGGKAGRIAMIFTTVLIAAQMPTLHRAWRAGFENKERWKDAARLAEFVADRNLDAVFGDIWEHWINFASDEKVCFCYFDGEPYAPRARKGELATACAVIDNVTVPHRLMDFRAFMRNAGGSCRTTGIGLFRAHWDAKFPESGSRAIAPDSIAAVTDEGGRDVANVVLDGDARTALPPIGPGAERSLEFSFKAPVRAVRVRLLCEGNSYCDWCSIDARRSGEAGWFAALARAWRTGYFRSGPRFFWGGSCYRAEYSIACEGGLDAIRLTLGGVSAVSEVQLFEPFDGPAADAGRSLPALLDLLSERGVSRLFADRWEAARVHEAFAGAIESAFSRPLLRDVQDLAGRENPSMPVVVALSADTAFLTPAGEAATTRRTLERKGVFMRETGIGPWVMFDFGPGDWKEIYGFGPMNCVWTGTALLAGGAGTAKEDAWWNCRAAAALLKSDPFDPRAIALLEEALRLYPNALPALRALPPALRRAGRADEAGTYERTLLTIESPAVPAAVRFSNGAELLGLGAETNRVRRGGRVGMRYHWECPSAAKPADLVFFVHFAGKTDMPVFQDDHRFLEGAGAHDIAYRPFEEVFVVERSVAVPASVPPGQYGVCAGLYDRRTGRRLAPVSDLPVTDWAVRLPFCLTVVE